MTGSGSTGVSCQDALRLLTAGWMAQCGPVTALELSESLQLPAADMERTLLTMEASGGVLRGRFTHFDTRETEWCDRRLLAQIHPLTLGALREHSAPINPPHLMWRRLHC